MSIFHLQLTANYKEADVLSWKGFKCNCKTHAIKPFQSKINFVNNKDPSF